LLIGASLSGLQSSVELGSYAFLTTSFSFVSVSVDCVNGQHIRASYEISISSSISIK